MFPTQQVNWGRVALGIGMIALGIGLFFTEATKAIAPAILGFGIGYLVNGV